MAGINKQSDVHIDVPLSNLVLDYGRLDMIGDKVLPRLTVANDTGKYYQWDRNFIDVTGLTTRRADRARPLEINPDVTLDEYSMEQHALETFLPDGIMKNSDSMLAVRMRYAQNVIDVMDLIKEIEIKDLVFDASNYSSDNKLTLTGNDRWATLHSDSDPLDDIQQAQLDVLKNAGVWPDRLLVGVELYMKLKRHPDIIASVQYVQRTGIRHITDSELADYLGLREIIVGRAVYNSAKPGQDRSNAFVWSDDALLFWRPDNNSVAMEQPHFGFQFFPSHTPRTVERFRENGVKGDTVQVNEKRFMKLTFPGAGFLFKGAGATA